MKAEHRKKTYQRLGYPMILAACMLLALAGILVISSGGAVLAAPDESSSAVDAAPVAVDDAYTTTGYAPLDIPAPGVLDNDSDPDGDPLMAILDNGPGNGSLTCGCVADQQRGVLIGIDFLEHYGVLAIATVFGDRNTIRIDSRARFCVRYAENGKSQVQVAGYCAINFPAEGYQVSR